MKGSEAGVESPKWPPCRSPFPPPAPFSEALFLSFMTKEGPSLGPEVLYGPRLGSSPACGLRPLKSRVTPSRTWRHFQAQPSLSVAPCGRPWAPGGFLGLWGDYRPSACRRQCCVDTPDAGSCLWAQFCDPKCAEVRTWGLLNCAQTWTEAWGRPLASFLGLWRFRPELRALPWPLSNISPNLTQERVKEFHWSGNGRVRG